MSVQAIVWVLEDCPDLPKHLVAPLVGLANHADQNGRGAYPSQELLGWYARKDERSIRRDLEQLEQLELIAPGDQRMVLHIPADRRPVVYDLAMTRKRDPRPDAGRAGRPKKAQVKAGEKNGGTSTSARISDDAEKRGDAHVPPDVHVKNGGTPTSNRGDAHVPLTALEPSVEPTPLALAAAEPAAAVSAELGDGGDSLEDETRKILNDASAAAAAVRIGTPGWSRRQIGAAMKVALEAGHPVDLVATTMAELAADPGTDYPGRIRPYLDSKTRPAAAGVDAPAWAAPTVTYLDPKRKRCDDHRDYPADNCAQHRKDAEIAARDADELAEAERLDAATARAAIRAQLGRPRGTSAPAQRVPRPDGAEPLDRAGQLAALEALQDA